MTKKEIAKLRSEMQKYFYRLDCSKKLAGLSDKEIESISIHELKKAAYSRIYYVLLGLPAEFLLVKKLKEMELEKYTSHNWLGVKAAEEFEKRLIALYRKRKQLPLLIGRLKTDYGQKLLESNFRS